ncbi:MAG: adaptor protein MecA [Acutalibacteraceae bacterium]
MKTQQNKPDKRRLLSVKPRYKETLCEYINSESLTQCILMLYKKNPALESSLYKVGDCYNLIIKSCHAGDTANIKEFCSRYSNSDVEISVTKEYGKLLIENNAVKTYGTAFSRAL